MAGIQGAGRSSGRDGRAQSEPVGIVLVLAIVLAGMSLTVAVGGDVLETTQSTLDVSRAEATMTQLDSQAAMVALGNSGSQNVRLPGGPGATYSVDNDSGWVSVTYRDYRSMTDEAIMDRRSMGEITYENGDERIAYQGGGVWRQSDEGSVMVSPPEFHYRNATLTFPFVTVSGESRLDGEAVITSNGTDQRFPDASRPGFENPLTNGRVWVTVHSRYYEAWGSYFEQRTDGEVAYDHANERVTLTLVIPTTYPPVTGGVVSGAPSGTMIINNEAGLDSYDSRDGEYTGDLKSGSPDETGGNVVVAGDLEVEKADVYGDVTVGRELSFTHNHGRLHHGNITYGLAVDPEDPYAAGHWNVSDPSTSRYYLRDGADVDEPDSVLSLIDDRRVAFQADNDNDGDDDVDETTDEYDCLYVCRLDGGSYYLADGWDVDEDLEFNVTEENVSVVVDGRMDVDSDVDVTVVGDHRVNVYVEEEVVLDNGAEIEHPDDDATQFWLYTNPDERVALRNNANLTGVVYGPGVETTPGTEIVLKQNADVRGGLVGDLRIQNNNVGIHYDEALADTEAVTHRTSLPALTFLHVTEDRVNVTSP